MELTRLRLTGMFAVYLMSLPIKITPPLEHDTKILTRHKRTSLTIRHYRLCPRCPHFLALCRGSLWQKECQCWVTWLVRTSQVMGIDWTAVLPKQAAATSREYSGGSGISAAPQLTSSKASEARERANGTSVAFYLQVIKQILAKCRNSGQSSLLCGHIGLKSCETPFFVFEFIF